MNQLQEMLFVVVAKMFGELREIVGVRVNRQGEFFVFPPYSRLVGEPHVHTSKHLSGERHFVQGIGKNQQTIPETKVRLKPLSTFKGIELLMGMSAWKGQFSDLRLPGTNKGEVVSIDLDSAHFGDDAFFVRVYLLEPRKEELVPTPSDVGPRVLHFIKKTKPWVAVDIFQQAP